MLTTLKRFIFVLSNKIRYKNLEYRQNFKAPQKKYVLDFARLKKTPFNIKPESSYNANLSKGSFELGLKISNCIAWVDIPKMEYQDHVIEAKIRLNSLGGYAAAGIVFHMLDDVIYGEESFYLTLVSNKGYFRLDAVKNNAPNTIIAWSEITNPIHSDFDGTNINLKIITYGTKKIFIVNNNWIGEVNSEIVDEFVEYGRLGFALASYSESEENKTRTTGPEKIKYTCKAYLDYISIETRVKKIEDEYKYWKNDSNINAERRLRLAETYAVMGEAQKALEQIDKAWKRRDETIRSITASFSEIRTKKELLLAARMYFLLEQYNEAEEYIDQILEQEPGALNPVCVEKELAYTEKLRILNESKRYEDLKAFVLKNQKKITKDIDYYTLTAHCYWELKEYLESAKAWEGAFKTNSENGVYAANAANAYEFAGKKKEALKLYIEAVKIFINRDNNAELAALIPKLTALGGRSKEAKTLLASIPANSGAP
ncbi:MAG: hypothetical protein LBC80_07695 [Treponema sp.]|jgi:tetratricopeptide (TPR) repeat protein|nr:hypothetical protein [Treponema sp.]